MTTTSVTTPVTTTDRTPTARRDRRISARVRILLWLLLMMAVALAAVATTTRSLLLRDIDHRINQLLTQETQEFGNFVPQGVDPNTGRTFTDPDTLLRVFLQRQYSDPDEELLGLIRPERGGLQVVRQSREIRSAVALHPDRASLSAILDSDAASGVLSRPAGEVRWAKVPIDSPGSGRPAAFVVAFHADGEKALADDAFRTLLVISGVALLLTTGIGWVVAGRILAPVRVVRATAEKLTEQDLTRRIPVQGRDDIAALAETFNAMLDRLERAFAGQRQFVDDAGHELRTPITIVRGHLEVMGDDPAEQRETVRLVTDELDRMSRIVEDLLLLAKAERPDFVRPEPVQLGELTADVFVKARALGERDWVLGRVADREAVLDPQRITQAMVQLAQNAVQHTVPGARIEIGSRETGGAVELYVTDSGPGVQEQDAEVIFERFRRGTARRGARTSGAGLGLSIVRAIAEGHRGGRVELRRPATGGASFVLVLEDAS
ncbi:ATP-binding protein [Streptomyces sp. NPDC005805]|uniref:sensor histidine kinase n=1 Tax=Streptomyces sp. NPDC005805 TaxID=3157068 RepID=UPI0033C24582